MEVRRGRRRRVPLGLQKIDLVPEDEAAVDLLSRVPEGLAGREAGGVEGAFQEQLESVAAFMRRQGMHPDKLVTKGGQKPKIRRRLRRLVKSSGGLAVQPCDEGEETTFRIGHGVGAIGLRQELRSMLPKRLKRANRGRVVDLL